MGRGQSKSEAGAKAWSVVEESLLADSVMAGAISPIDEAGRDDSPPLVDDPEAVFNALDKVSERLRDLINGIEDPWDFYPTLMAEVPAILEDPELPEIVRGAIGRLVKNVELRIQRIYEEAERTPDEDLEDVAQRVMRDVKAISFVPLKDEEVLNNIQVESVAVDEIPGLVELIPQVAHMTEHTGMKGGAARVALKLYALQQMDPAHPQAAVLLESIKAEFPLSDIDLVITEDESDPNGFADSMDVHPVDIEILESFGKGVLIDHFGRRDLSSNQALLTGDTLYFNKGSLRDLRSAPGRAESVVSPIAGLFGRESFFVNKRPYLAANTLYRLVKMVAEGKNDSFNVPQYNLDAITIGRYWLTMVRKWMNKENGAEVFARAYSCATQMGVTEAPTPAEFLEELLEEDPDFDFGSEQTLLDVTKWLLKKYVIFLEKILRRTFKLKPQRVNDIFSSTDSTRVTVSPDTSDVDADQLGDVQTIFDRIRADIPPREAKPVSEAAVGAAPEAVDGVLGGISKQIEEKQAGMRAQLEEMRARGLQVGDTVHERYEEGFVSGDYEVTSFEDGTAHCDKYDWRAVTFPTEAVRAEIIGQSKRFMGPKKFDPAWVVPEGKVSQKPRPRPTRSRRGGLWGW